jgi:hypothetical protein
VIIVSFLEALAYGEKLATAALWVSVALLIAGVALVVLALLNDDP